MKGRAILPQELIRNHVMTERREMRHYKDLSETERIDLHLDTVRDRE